MTEFDLIARYFDRPSPGNGTVRLGIGDDCALLAPRAGHELAVSSDMLVAGRHFFDDADPASIGWKTVAVNLSDLAAMGARPIGFTLALALPELDEAWLASFCGGLFACADRFDCPLIGGDTTRGPLTLCVTIFGEVPDGQALRRSAAQPGDDVWVSGVVGSAALALQRAMQVRHGRAGTVTAELAAALDRPVPRIALGIALRGTAHAAIDVSDGLAQDLGHVLKASGCGADIDLEALPCSKALAACSTGERLRLMLAGGDDYELCFTAPVARRRAVERAAADARTSVTRIGTATSRRGLRLFDAQGADSLESDPVLIRGFDHFA